MLNTFVIILRRIIAFILVTSPTLELLCNLNKCVASFRLHKDKAFVQAEEKLKHWAF